MDSISSWRILGWGIHVSLYSSCAFIDYLNVIVCPYPFFFICQIFYSYLGYLVYLASFWANAHGFSEYLAVKELEAILCWGLLFFIFNKISLIEKKEDNYNEWGKYLHMRVDKNEQKCTKYGTKISLIMRNNYIPFSVKLRHTIVVKMARSFSSRRGQKKRPFISSFVCLFSFYSSYTRMPYPLSFCILNDTQQKDSYNWP